jgi:AcrR family transcriptional regulator
VNDCLYPDPPGDVNVLDRDTAMFFAAFAQQPDLAELTDAALRVLATAAALFYRRGAAATSVRDVTQACGLTPGALYNHFASKDDLLYTLVRHGHESMLRRLDLALAEAAPAPAAQFVAFVRAYVTGHLVFPELALLVRRDYLHLSEHRRETIVTERRDIRRQLSAILLAGADRGEFDLIGGSAGTSGASGATGAALMVLDMCSRTSEWFDRHGPADIPELTERYVSAAQRLVGAAGAVPARPARSGRASVRSRARR